MNPLPTPPPSASSHTPPPLKSLPSLPPEIWAVVCSFLQEDRRAELLENSGDSEPAWHRRSLESFSLTCKTLYEISLPAWNQFVMLGWWNTKWIKELKERRRTPEALMFKDHSNLPVYLAVNQVNYPTELVIWQRCLHKEEFKAILHSPRLTSLTLRGVEAELLFAQEPMELGDVFHSGSRIQTLDLDYSCKPWMKIPQKMTLLVLVPDLKTLLTTPGTFKEIGQFLATGTFTMPQIRHLKISSDGAGSLDRSHLLSFLHRCPTLETVQISRPIRSRPLAQGEVPADMLNLVTYEGRPEYLTYFHAPALRRAVVKCFLWDGGALITVLASMSTDLESLVIELTSSLDAPVMSEIKQWVEVAAGRWSPHCDNAQKFSLVLRTAPLGEWIYSARAGRNDIGELFIKYFSRREDAMTYLLNRVTVEAAE